MIAGRRPTAAAARRTPGSERAAAAGRALDRGLPAEGARGGGPALGQRRAVRRRCGRASSRSPAAPAARARRHAAAGLRRSRTRFGVPVAAHLTCAWSLARARSTSSRARLLGQRHPPHRGAARRPAQGRGALRAARRRLRLRRRPGRRPEGASPISRSASAATPRSIPRPRAPAADLDNLKRKVEAGATRADHPVLLRHRPDPALPRSAGRRRHRRPSTCPASCRSTTSPRSSASAQGCGAGIPAWLERAVRRARRELADARHGRRQRRRRAVPPAAAEGLTADARLHAQPRRAAAGDLPPPRRARRRAVARPPPERSPHGRFPRLRPRAACCCSTAPWAASPGAATSTLDDFWGQENCTEILNLSRARPVREIHLGYLAAGADAVETNSFGGSPITLGEFGLAGPGARDQPSAPPSSPARRSRASPATAATRFVVGSIGPGTKLPSLGHVAYRELEEALRRPGRGPDRRRRRRAPDRDLPGPAADQGRGQRRRQRVVAPRPASCRSWSRSRSRPPARMLVGTDIARRDRDRRRARRAGHRPQLRHRPAGDGRARALARRRTGRGLISVPAQCRPARAGRRPDPLSAGAGRAGAAGSSASSPRTASTSSAAAAAPTAEHIAALDAMLRRLGRGRLPAARRSRAQPQHDAVARLAVLGRAAAPGERVSSPSASAATPTARRSSASCRRPATGTAASPWAASRCARAATRSTSAPPSSAATRSPR